MLKVLVVLLALAASLLLAAAMVACICRVRNEGRRTVLRIVLWIAAVLPWAAAAGGLTIGFNAFPAYKPEAIVMAVAAALFVAALNRLYRRAIRQDFDTGMPEGAAWPRGKLAVASLAAWAVCGACSWITVAWAREELDSIGNEARAAALSISPDNVSDSQNAALVYQQALDELNGDPNFGDTWRTKAYDWFTFDANGFDANNAEMREFLSRHKTAMELLHRAGQMPACHFGKTPYADEMYQFPMGMTMTRNAARLLLASARVNVADGDIPAAMGDISDSMRLVDHLAGVPLFLPCLISISVDATNISALEQILASQPAAQQALGDVYLSDGLDFNRALGRSIRMETAHSLGTMTEGRMGEAIAAWDPADNGTCALFKLPAKVQALLLKKETERFRQWSRDADRFCELPYWQSGERWAQTSEDANKAGILSGVLVTGFAKMPKWAAIADARHRACLAGVAMLRYRVKNGRLPEKLDELVPEFLPAVPVDPFTGQPLKVARRPEGVMIYSVGPDLIDDGGSREKDKSTGQEKDVGFLIRP